jgi:zinc/manganese transport system substrate-binding protein
VNILELDFMRNAFIAGGCVAIAAGLVGYFVVLRNQVFTADALGHVAFTGSLGGVIAGLNVLVSAFASCVGVALAIGTLGGRGRGRDVAIGTVFAWVLGVGVLFLAIYTTAQSASGNLGVSVLFGSILSLQPFQVLGASVASIATSAVLVLIARPLLFLSVDPDVAIARGVPSRALLAIFLILLAITVAVAVQAVGALLIFALLVTPAAAAQNLTARPYLGMVLSAFMALVAVWAGLVVAYYFPYPASFLITSVAFAVYLASSARRRFVAAGIALLMLAACGSPAQSGSGKTEVVAAENFWGSIASQVGGDRVHVTSIISNPATDPHDYDPTPHDARLFAQASYVIVNGAGYDAWATKLLDANPEPGRKVLDVGALEGVPAGGNPHLWYSPSIVEKVIHRVGADLGDTAAAQALWDTGFKDYRDSLDAIRQHAGARVGATESIFAYLAKDAGLDLITPRAYMNAVAEGADPSAADKAQMITQIDQRQIKVLVYNAQNSTPEVADVIARARAHGIPIVQISETLAPAGATFQDWQTAQLHALLQALTGAA